MIIINLDTDFAPFGAGLTITNSLFPSKAELSVRIPLPPFKEAGFDGNVCVTARVASSDDIMSLMLVADALERIPEVKTKCLFLPFMPYARQDHIVAEGEALSLKVIGRMINSCNWDKVTVFDPHSDVTAALIEHIEVTTNIKLVQKVLEGKSNYWLLSPDGGAYKKVGKLADEIGYERQVIVCGKVRDPRPEHKGKIMGMHVPEMDYQGLDVYMLDDIIEGGRTFIGIATELQKRNAGKIYLIVSHPVLSWGDTEVRKHLDGIFTTDSFVPVGTYDKDFVTEIKLCTIL